MRSYDEIKNKIDQLIKESDSIVRYLCDQSHGNPDTKGALNDYACVISTLKWVLELNNTNPLLNPGE